MLSACLIGDKEACCVVWYPLLDGGDITPFYQRAAEIRQAHRRYLQVSTMELAAVLLDQTNLLPEAVKQDDVLIVEFGFEASQSSSLQRSGMLITHVPEKLGAQLAGTHENRSAEPSYDMPRIESQLIHGLEDLPLVLITEACIA